VTETEIEALKKLSNTPDNSLPLSSSPAPGGLVFSKQAVFNWVHLARAQLGMLKQDIEYDFSVADVTAVPASIRAAEAAKAVQTADQSEQAHHRM
jgi:hypothetical protein